MPIDIAKMTDRIKGKKPPEMEPAAAEPDGDEGGGMSPGEMALQAIAAKDPAALEEAIRRCVEEQY